MEQAAACQAASNFEGVTPGVLLMKAKSQFGC
jgi:hypothetical protein